MPILRKKRETRKTSKKGRVTEKPDEKVGKKESASAQRKWSWGSGAVRGRLADKGEANPLSKKRVPQMENLDQGKPLSKTV